MKMHCHHRLRRHPSPLLLTLPPTNNNLEGQEGQVGGAVVRVLDPPQQGIPQPLVIQKLRGEPNG